MIDLYTWPTPNGYKPLIAVEEMGIDYTIHKINIGEGEQKQPDFVKLNPNGRIPAMVDRANGDFAVFESGAMLVYLAEKSGQFNGRDDKNRSQVLQWLMFQMGGVGPMMGQANVFVTFYPKVVPEAIERYQNEVKRLFGVMDGHLADHEYFANDYSIADMATWPWVRGYPMSGASVDDFPNLKRWFDTIAERPAVKAALEKLPGRDPHTFAREMQAKRAANYR